MLNLQSVEDLKKFGIELYDGMPVSYPTRKLIGSNEVKGLDLMKIHEGIEKFNRKLFNENNGSIIFYNGETEAVEFHSFPATAEVTDILFNEGYRLDPSIYVPFSNGDYPDLEAQQWFGLKKHYQGPRLKKERRIACMKRSKEENIMRLPKGITSRYCLHVPECGFEVFDHFHGDAGYMVEPYVRSVDCTTDFYLGKYCVNNQVVVIIDADGETYLAGASKMLFKCLRDHGFKEIKLMVPLSNGESIKDSKIKSKWKVALKLAIEADLEMGFA